MARGASSSADQVAGSAIVNSDERAAEGAQAGAQPGLWTDGRIRGWHGQGLYVRILDARGEPVVGANVWLRGGAQESYQLSGVDGRVHYRAPGPGELRVSAGAAGHSSVRDVPLRPAFEQGRWSCELKLRAPGELAGSVAREWLRPALWVSVHERDSGRISQWTRVAGDGEFRFEGLAAGPKTLRLLGLPPSLQQLEPERRLPRGVKRAPAWRTPQLSKLFADVGELRSVDVEAGALSRVHFGPPPTTAIRLRASFEDERVSDGSCTLIVSSLGGTDWAQSSWIRADGAFEVHFPRAGRYSATWMKGLREVLGTPWQFDLAGDREQVARWTPPTGSLRVRTLDDQGRPLSLFEDGLFGRRLELRRQDGSSASLPGDRSVPGQILFSDLAPGTYLLHGTACEAHPGSWRDNWSHSSTRLWSLEPPVELVIASSPVVFEPRLTRAVDFRGQIRDPSSSLSAAPRAALRVEAWSDSGRTCRLTTAPLQQSGAFELEALPLGEVHLWIVSSSATEPFECSLGSTLVTDEQRTRVEFVLP